MSGWCCLAADAVIRDHTHLSWTARDGAPSGVSSLVQTRDRYLWIGTTLGLYRFDGSRFAAYPFQKEQQPLLSSNISTLVADPRGGLWIGYRLGGVSYLDNGVLRNFGAAEGLKYDSTEQLLRFIDGSIWCVAGGRLWSFDGKRWINFGEQHELASDGILTAFQSRDSTIWVSDHKHVYALRRGTHRFEEVAIQTFSVSQFFELDSGELWIADGWRSVRPLYAKADSREIQLKGIAAIFVDRGNELWLAQDYAGVLRTKLSTGAAESFSTRDGLSSMEVRAVLKDDEDNVWFGTNGGLDRFRPTVFHPFSRTSLHGSPALAANDDGSIWVAALGEPLRRVRGGKIELEARTHGVSAMASDHRRGVWIYDFWTHALFHYAGATPTKLAPPPAVRNAVAQSLVLDTHGNLFAAFEGEGLWKYDGAWHSIQTSRSTAGETPLTMRFGSSGSLWLGYRDSLVVELDARGNEKLHDLRARNIGSVLTFEEVGGALWLGGTEGVTILSGDPPESQMRGVSGIALARDGSVWLNGGSGIARITKTHEIYDQRYGVSGVPAQLRPNPSAITDSDGRLWFARAGQLFHVDPGPLPVNTSVPAIRLESVRWNNTEQPVHVPLKAPISAWREFELAFGAIELTSPERVQFRYRLNDEELSLSSARAVTYGRLPAGNYTFEVSATNGNGQWSEPVRYQFTVEPAFYQTIWFVLLCTAAGVGLIYLIYLARVRYVAGRMRSIFEERVRERMRIARDLHDTLLQTIQALTLRFHYAVEDMPDGEPAKAELAQVLTRAEAAIHEAREHVQSLRADARSSTDLNEHLASLLAEFQSSRSAEYRLQTQGVSVPLHPLAQDEMYRVANEAVRNASLHSGASRIDVTVVYDRRSLQLICADNGKGIASDVLRAGGRPGHWGLPGMRERAASLDAEFIVESAAGTGTRVVLTVPGARAYLRPGLGRGST